MVANEWKDANDKVMPVRQWLEDRRFLQVIVVYCHFSLSVFWFVLAVYVFEKSCCAQLLFSSFIFISAVPGRNAATT